MTHKLMGKKRRFVKRFFYLPFKTEGVDPVWDWAIFFRLFGITFSFGKCDYY